MMVVLCLVWLGNLARASAKAGVQNKENCRMGAGKGRNVGQGSGIKDLRVVRNQELT